MHHEWTSPMALTAVYCHPLEHILVNLFPSSLGPILVHNHITSVWLWSVYAILRTLTDHSGYHLPGFPSPEFHQFHHMKFNECYGVLDFFDYFRNIRLFLIFFFNFNLFSSFSDWTDKAFRSSAASRRHIFSMKTASVREQFPDTDDES